MALRWFAIGWIAIVLGLLLVQMFAPQRSGVLALTEVLEPFIVLTGVVLVPLALIGGERIGVAVVVILAVAVVARYGPGLTTGPISEATPAFTVTAWNVEAGDDGGQRILDGLAGTTSDLVALEELQPEMANALATDPTFAATYPYRALFPNSSVLGVGLMSRYPIVEQSSTVTDVAPAEATEPPYLRAVVAKPSQVQPTVVYVVHPLPGRIQTALGMPFALDTIQRDADLAMIRAAIDADLAAGRDVIVMGDINTTPREPAYADFRKDLNDARSAGTWPGLTWRWDPLKSLPFGLLRIDYVFSTGAPTSYSVRCTELSDHCIVSAAIQLPNVIP